MPNTYTLIASSTVGVTSVASIDFTSIPSTYTDLVLKLSLRTNRAGAVDDDIYVKLNGATTNFTYKYLKGSGSTVNSSAGSVGYAAGINAAGATANTFANTEIYIPSYRSADYKSISVDSVTENNTTESYCFFQSVLWANTAAITSIGIVSGTSNNFVQYSTAHLYGFINS